MLPKKWLKSSITVIPQPHGRYQHGLLSSGRPFGPTAVGGAVRDLQEMKQQMGDKYSDPIQVVEFSPPWIRRGGA